MTTKTTRRSLILGGSAMFPALALPAIAAGSITQPAAAAPGRGDAKLQSLWATYQQHAKEYLAAKRIHDPRRAAFDAEMPPCPEDVFPGDHWDAHQALYEKHGCAEPWDAMNRADAGMREAIRGILTTEAEGMIGIGIKLAALPGRADPEDYVDCLRAAFQDIDRLVGTDFAATLAAVETANNDAEIVDDGAERAREKQIDAEKVITAIEVHKKANKHLSSVIDDQAKVDVESNFNKVHTADTKRRRRNVERRMDRAHAREQAAFQALLTMRTQSDAGRSVLIGYLRAEIDRRGGDLQREELMPLLDNVHSMVTPPWLVRMAAVQAAEVAA